MDERWALVLLGLPFVLYCLIHPVSNSRTTRRIFEAALAAVLVWALLLSNDYEQMYLDFDPHAVVRRDYAASVISFGSGMDKSLFVNGVGMTRLTPITKFMAHLPLALHVGSPTSALVICFGMGTTYRSALAWNIDTTAVELVPGVVEQFGYYHSDAPECLANPNGRVIIDDGRRFLKRCGRRYDVIVIDPPPPVEAAGSSLLFSTEFYELAKQHLNKNGIVQMWYPGSNLPTTRAVLRSFGSSFPYMRTYISMEGWAAHLLGSMEPIPDLTAKQLAARMPRSAVAISSNGPRSTAMPRHISTASSPGSSPWESISTATPVQMPSSPTIVRSTNIFSSGKCDAARLTTLKITAENTEGPALPRCARTTTEECEIRRRGRRRGD